MSKADSSHTIIALATAAESPASLFTRRSVTAGLAAAVTAIPAVGLAKGVTDHTEDAELHRLFRARHERYAICEQAHAECEDGGIEHAAATAYETVSRLAGIDPAAEMPTV